MTTYTFKVTKGKYQLTFSTTDRDMIVDEFEKWVRAISYYVQKNKGQEIVERVNSQINTEKELTQKRVEEQLKRIPKPEVKKEEIKNDIDVFYAPPQPQEETSQPTINPENEKQESQSIFDTMLDKSLQTPQTELSFKPSPSIKKDNAFLNFISSRKVERKIDYLLMTAYYFTQYEQKPRFTLKQLNAKLMQNVAIILDHSVVQEALNRDYIECLPDLTGIVGSSEYRLTAYGEKTLLEEG